MLKDIENLGTALTKAKQQNILGGQEGQQIMFNGEKWITVGLCTEEDQPGYYDKCKSTGSSAGGGSGGNGDGDE